MTLPSPFVRAVAARYVVAPIGAYLGVVVGGYEGVGILVAALFLAFLGLIPTKDG